MSSIDFVLFSITKPDFIVSSWSSITNHSVGIITGWKIMEKNFGLYSDKIVIVKIENSKLLFTLLIKDRVDFIAFSKWAGLAYIKSNYSKKIKLLKPPLASVGSFVYLHNKHESIVPLLSAAIKKMKDDGTITTLYNKILLPYSQ